MYSGFKSLKCCKNVRVCCHYKDNNTIKFDILCRCTIAIMRLNYYFYIFRRTDSVRRGRLRKESDGSEGSSRWGFRRRDRSGQQDSGRPPSVESSHESGMTRGSFRFSSSKSRKSSTCGPDVATISDIFRRKASTKSNANEPLHGHYSGFSSPMTFSPPMSPPPLQHTPMPPSVRLKQPHGNVFAPASEANATVSSLSHQPIVLRPVPTSHNAAARRLSRITTAPTEVKTERQAISTTTTAMSPPPPALLLSPVASITRTTTPMTSAHGATSMFR